MRKNTHQVCKECVGVGLSIRGFWRVVRVIITLGHGLPVCGCLLIRCRSGVVFRCWVSSRWIICSWCPVACRCVISCGGVVASCRGIVTPGWSVVAHWRGGVAPGSVVRSWGSVWFRCGVSWRGCVCPWGRRGCGGSLCLCCSRWRGRWRRICVGILEVLILLLVLLILLVLMHLLVVICVRPRVHVRVKEYVKRSKNGKNLKIKMELIISRVIKIHY